MSVNGLRPYPAYRDSGVEWLGRVPEHWEARRLKGLAKILNGATPASGRREYWGGDILWLTPEDLGRLRGRDIRHSRRSITRVGYESCGTTLAPAGSTVMSTRAPIGHLAILGREACTNQGCRLLVPENDAVVPEWAYLGLLTARSELQALGQGTTFAELSRDALGAFALPLPPLPEQHAIARFLEAADRRIRRYIRAKERLVELLEERKRALIHEAVTGRIDVRTGQPYPAYKDSGVEWLGKVPEHWEVVQLGRIAVARCDGPFGSGLKSSHYMDRGVRVLRLQNIGHGEFRNDDSAFISVEHYSTLGDHSVVPEDVLIAGLGDRNQPAGRACVAPRDIGPTMVKADCFRFRLDRSQALPRFVALQLTATALGAAGLSRGATRQRINLSRMSGRRITLPTIQQQRSIIEYVTRKIVATSMLQDNAERQIALLREYRTRLIADVVTGKLDVREAVAELPGSGSLANPGASEHEAPRSAAARKASSI